MNTPRFRKLADLGEIHGLLLKCSPTDERGEKSITTLAKALELTHTAIYKWIENKKIPSKWALRLVELSGGVVDIREFDKFIYCQGTTSSKTE